MRKTLKLITLFLFVIQGTAFGETKIDKNPHGNVKWTAGSESMPGNIKAFQENKGQFRNLLNGWKVLYGADYDGGQILFTDHGVVYELPQMINDTSKEGEDIGEEKEQKEKKKTIFYNVGIEWENVNSGLTIEAQDETPFYFRNIDVKSINPIKGYTKLIYHNVYPGIDIEYTFHKNKGIEYSFKINPGVDPSIIKMKYIGDKGISIINGNVHISTKLGDIVDHAPITSQNADQQLQQTTTAINSTLNQATQDVNSVNQIDTSQDNANAVN